MSNRHSTSSDSGCDSHFSSSVKSRSRDSRDSRDNDRHLLHSNGGYGIDENSYLNAGRGTARRNKNYAMYIIDENEVDGMVLIQDAFTDVVVPMTVESLLESLQGSEFDSMSSSVGPLRHRQHGKGKPLLHPLHTP
jgi:hypothetical protein